ncbi:hypothetical protein ACHAWU_005143 [Discostella pseudostelligera]|uniref:MI domain-containing protein n=1 Tax=Discostella pseudostelligera TaxID=259834 RepID=A0ABD3M1D8_9STRA
MKSKARRKEASNKGSGSGGGGGGIVIEAANRKARRKEERHAKKKKPPQQPLPLSSKAQRNVDTSSPANNKKKLDIQHQQSNKRVKFSNVVHEQTIPSVKNHIPTGLKKSSLKQQSVPIKSNSSKSRNGRSYYDNLDAETAAALRKDDMEIEYLESNLGIKSNSNRKNKDRDGSSSSSRNASKELNREYAKNEGFGDDFGDFLMGLDDLVERCVGGGDDGRKDSSGSSSESGGDSEEEDDSASDSGDKSDDSANIDPHDKAGIGELGVDSDSNVDENSEDEDASLENDNNDDAYAHLDKDTALALRNDDAEIAALEEKLGLSGSSKARKKLNKEFASSFMGYGEDFGDFLDELDLLSDKVGITRRGDENDSMQSDNSVNSANRDDESSSEESGSEDDTPEDTADHDESLTYRPTSGEDIYGNKIDSSQSGGAKPTKYIPPHLRNKDTAITDDTADDNAKHTTQPIAADPETVLLIQRQINNALNRLSEQTLESVSKSLASIYSKYPSRDVNDCLWKNIQMACVFPHMVMSGLIPLYVGAISGVHWLGGDGILLGGSLVEWSVTELFISLKKVRKHGDTTEEDEDSESIDKEATNILLIVCYLYNYGVIHCSLIYDLVRDFIRNFTEIDVEALLIVLSHCGQQLRSDDPSALKEIVLLVKDRAQKVADTDSSNENDSGADSSRVEFMVDSIIELRNNKPRKQDVAIREKTNVLKKSIGRIKTSASRLLAGKKSGSCLRLTLRDVLDADTKGRWWMVGASWAGNQNKDILFGDPDADGPDRECNADKVLSKSEADEDGLLALASSQRMNTDARRAIFCIIMGSSDFDDAFEKLVRQGMLKPKVERDVIRVIVHCCGEEEAFNPFYAYLAIRCCEYQPKSRFTLMLTFWDIFKQLETFSDRKVANLAKLLAHLVGSNDKCLNIGVLKRIEFSPTSMPEMVIVFLSIFMTSLFESNSGESVQMIFSHGATPPEASATLKAKSKDFFDDDDDDDDDDSAGASRGKTKKEDLSDLRENLSLFLLQYLKASPKNVEGSAFHSNLMIAISS